MFVILTYDVRQKRHSKTRKICKKYLYHVQKSVFEGYLTERQLKKGSSIYWNRSWRM